MESWSEPAFLVTAVLPSVVHDELQINLEKPLIREDPSGKFANMHFMFQGRQKESLIFTWPPLNLEKSHSLNQMVYSCYICK